jgi:transposase
MDKIEFTTAERETLHYWRFHHPHPRVQRKMEALYLKSQGLAPEEIRRLCAISTTTFYRYLHEYREGGIAHLQEVRFHRRRSQLANYRTSIEADLRQRPPASVAEAAARIADLTGLQRGPTQVRQFLKSLGMKPRKVGQIPAKVDVIAQEAFKKDQLEPCLTEAKSGQRVVFFMDAAHFVFAPFLGLVWCFERLFIKAPSGRQRLNVLAALHATTREIFTVTNLTYITSETVCELLRPHSIAFSGAGVNPCRLP